MIRVEISGFERSILAPITVEGGPTRVIPVPVDFKDDAYVTPEEIDSELLERDLGLRQR